MNTISKRVLSASASRVARAALVALSGLVLLAGCSIDLPGSSPPPRLYVLTPKSTFPKDLPNVKWQLLIEIPHSPAGVNTQRIVLRDSPIELKYFHRANWTDLAPKMVQALLVESFENSGHILAVGREAIGLRADYVLKTELREFQAEYVTEMSQSGQGVDLDAAPPQVRVAMNVKLVKLPRRSIVASKTFENVVDASANSMEAIIGAFDNALGKTLKGVVSWSLREGEAAAKQQ
ncbi:MAG: membrane integrity-associated transporter subunit PqiC [Alphaproteobacteria bacterium]|nr:membrane integrity-associated transporter subunit PqiC [Alphaproteobacteria bacterium]